MAAVDRGRGWPCRGPVVPTFRRPTARRDAGRGTRAEHFNKFFAEQVCVARRFYGVLEEWVWLLELCGFLLMFKFCSVMFVMFGF